MATRALAEIRKSSLVNAVRQASFPLRRSTDVNHGKTFTGLGSSSSGWTFSSPSVSYTLGKTCNLSPSLGFPWKNLACSPAFGSASTQPRSGIFLSGPRLGESVRCFSTEQNQDKHLNLRRRFTKQRRNRGEMKGVSDNVLSFGKYALQALEPAWITEKQIKAGELAIKRNMRNGKLFRRIFPHKPVSLRPAETRMGRGKGNISFWVAGVRAGRIIFEINGVPETVARKAITVAASKFPLRTRFVSSAA